jgi:GGDEF domain-containing protein
MKDLRDKAQDLTTTEVMNGLFMDLQIGCLNRNAFDARDSEYVALIDVDSLKWVNDNLGHAAGDDLLRAVANALQEVFGSDDVYRLSGDEFAVRSDARLALVSGLRDLDVPVSAGIGATLDEADDALQCSKEQRLLTGQRAPRGERPEWVYKYVR